MCDEGNNRDLREAWAAPAQRPPPQQDFTYVVNERGICGLRVVSKIIDYAALWAGVSMAITFSTFFWAQSWADRLEELSEQPEMEEFPWDVFAPFLIAYGIGITLFFVGGFFYHYLLENRFQQTLGKKAFELRVVDIFGARASSGQILGRAALRTLGMLTPYWVPDLMVMAARGDDRSLTDLICGTRVIRRRKVYNYSRVRAR